MKNYKVWVKVSIEEYDDDTEEYTDVTDDAGMIIADYSGRLFDINTGGDYLAAKRIAEEVSDSIEQVIEEY
jgi:hypothetical protein